MRERVRQSEELDRKRSREMEKNGKGSLERKTDEKPE